MEYQIKALPQHSLASLLVVTGHVKLGHCLLAAEVKCLAKDSRAPVLIIVMLNESAKDPCNVRHVCGIARGNVIHVD